MSSGSKSLTKEEKEELIQLLEILEFKELLKKKKKAEKRGQVVKKQKPRKAGSATKQKPKYVNELQKNIAKQFDINIPKPVPKSISKSYGK